uniref:Uncharacterized protein n=1 Tax=Beihai levi-like virus 2 TaxID=1922405 RepID=A0A1L3KI62_9VIRU|nr:hypothetical protein [Beihai levi-like virus 2]
MVAFNPSSIKYSQKPVGSWYDWVYDPHPKTGTFFAYTERDKGEMFSINHKPDPDGKYRRGGNWLAYKQEIRCAGSSNRTYRAGWGPAYEGTFIIKDSTINNWASELFHAVPDKDDVYNDCFSYGAQAYAALKPAPPDFSAASSLYELKEYLNPLKQKVLKHHKRQQKLQMRHGKLTAQMYIGYYFSWLPLFSDVRNFIVAFNNRKKRFDQLLRDEGKPVRRRRYLSKKTGDEDTSHEESWTAGGRGYNPETRPVLVTQCYAKYGGYGGGRKQTRNVSVWCAGAASYLLPPGPRDGPWKRKIMRRILGLYLSPSQVYQIIPWSWMADYFSGLGHFMDAVSGGVEDRLWFHYAYVMRKETKTGVFDFWGTTYDFSGAYQRYDTQARIKSVTMARNTASPFGWGLETPNSHQMSILGALGYSRLP